MELLRKYREASYEQKVLLHTGIGLCFSGLLGIGKFTAGLFGNGTLCVIAVYTFALLFAKLECILGVRSNKRSFKTRNTLVALLMMLSSLVYIGLTCRSLFVPPERSDRGLGYVGLLAFISFLEFGLAVAGILRSKNKGPFFRNIKIINFCIAMIAILTTQVAILDFTQTLGVERYNAYTGIGIGAAIAVLAGYILISPKIGLWGRETARFSKTEGEPPEVFELTLCRSRVYGSYFYRAKRCGQVLDGKIERGPSLWKRMHVVWKILCCILSEILLFVWLAGRLVFFLRTMDLPGRLEAEMRALGYEKE